MGFKARVIGGRLIVDEPTQLPEGFEMELGPIDPGDQMTDEERAQLHALIDESLAQDDAGDVIPAKDVLSELRAKR
jgi:hypothetical protein